jgi:hypothetical protein
VIVPSSDPLALGGAAVTPLQASDAWLAPAQPASEFTDKLASRLAYIAGGSVALLALAIVVTASINSLLQPRETPEVAAAKPAATASATQKKGSPSPAPSYGKTSIPLPPMPQSEPVANFEVPAPPGLSEDPATKIATAPVPQSIERPDIPVTPQVGEAATSGGMQSAGDLTMSRLPEAARSWLDQPEAQLLGIRRVGTITSPGAHFSWMTGLLPYLDHKQVYDRIDFSKPVTSATNLTVGTTVIPEFVNPHDERQRWKGYPMDGLALSHFAGMSGVEDSRNVVAAKLPRSDPRAGVFGYDEVARANDITDGTSQTIMIVGTGAMANPWMMGGGGTIRGAREPLFDNMTGLGMKGLAGGGTLAVMADGSVRHVSANIDPRVFKAMSTIHGAESFDVEQAAAPLAREEWKAMRRPMPSGSLPGRRMVQP